MGKKEVLMLVVGALTLTTVAVPLEEVCRLWTASDTLLPSGLLGPVKFLVEKSVC